MARRQINDGELHILYTSIGEGVWHLLNVEEALHTFIAIKGDIKIKGTVNKDEGEVILEKRRKMTLGRALENARQERVLSPGLHERMEKFRDERNWLIHRLACQHREDLYQDETREVLLIRIMSFIEEAKLLQIFLATELQDFVTGQGISKEEIYRIAHERIDKLKGRHKG